MKKCLKFMLGMGILLATLDMGHANEIVISTLMQDGVTSWLTRSLVAL